MEMFALILISAAVIVCFMGILGWYALTPSNLPPGPVGLPFVGCVPYIEPITAHFTLEEWRKKYGNLMSFYMGSTLVVVLANYDTIREALIRQGEVFNGRSVIRAFRATGVQEGLGLTGAEGEIWREQRGFCLKALKDFGAGRSVLEPKIRYEVQFLLDAISQSNGRPIDLKMTLHYAVSNVIVQLVFGKRFDYDDPVYVSYLEKLTFRLTNSGVNAMSAFNFFPTLLTLQTLLRPRVKTVLKDSAVILDFIRQFIRDKEAKFDVNAEVEDYMSAFLAAKKNGEGHHFHEDQLVIAVQQLFIAGSETTATVLRWAIWYMAKYPECQEKVYKEIMDTVGTDSPPLWSDHSKLPFTEATIFEVMRISNLSPLSITHRAVESTTLMGYHIPADAYVIPFLYAVHMDPKYFPEPSVFRPERFIDPSGQFIKSNACIPFSVGKRTCLGESLARMELFTYFTAMIQRFRFRFPEGNQCSGASPTVVGVIISPAPFNVIGEPRT